MKTIQINDIGLNVDYFKKLGKAKATEELKEYVNNPGESEAEKTEWAEGAWKAMSSPDEVVAPDEPASGAELRSGLGDDSISDEQQS